jgi:hypothetical protein
MLSNDYIGNYYAICDTGESSTLTVNSEVL